MGLSLAQDAFLCNYRWHLPLNDCSCVKAQSSIRNSDMAAIEKISTLKYPQRLPTLRLQQLLCEMNGSPSHEEDLGMKLRPKATAPPPSRQRPNS
jgi:hypothetical protein